MNCNDFGDYHDIYLKSDVLLLTDICESFRKLCYEHYELEVFNYISAPALSWDAMMLKCKMSLGLVYDEEVKDFLKKRGGICFAGAKRYAKANNKYMKNYVETEENSYIPYLDMNGLYGSAMCDYLPYNILGFSDKKYTIEEILKTPDNSKIGYFVEVNIRIPKRLHDYLKCYPPCPENMNVKTEWLSDYQKNIYKQNKSKHSEINSKLILNLFDK